MHRKSPKKIELPEVEVPAALTLLSELIDEQRPGARASAASDKNGCSMTFIAKGDYLAMLVVRRRVDVPNERVYLCRILRVTDKIDIAEDARKSAR